MKAWTVLIGVIGALAACGGIADEIGPIVNPAVPPAGLEAHETHAAASLLGQFRTNASSWLWLRTDLYLHNGVEMRPLSDEEVAAGKRGVGGQKDGHEAIMNDDRIVTIVPNEAQDFRGVFGDLERAVSTYKRMEGHGHNDPAQTLPLIRLMTWLDPQFVMAWVTGATIIARDRSDSGTTKALAFLDEAEAHNPNSVAVPTEKARLLATRRKDLAGARPLLEEAMRRGLRDPARLADVEKEGLNLAARLLALIYRDLGEFDLMRSHLDVSRRLFRDDPMFERLSEALDARSQTGNRS